MKTNSSMTPNLQQNPKNHGFLGVGLILVVLLLASCTYPGPVVPPTVTPPPYPAPAMMDVATVSPVQAFEDPYPGPGTVIEFPPGTLILFPVYNSRALRCVEGWEGAAGTSKVKPFITELAPDCYKLPVIWSHIETVQGVYTWASLDKEMAYLRSTTMLPILTIKMSPTWARAAGSTECARPTNIKDYADFVGQVVARYPGPIAVEIWNEPDTDAGAPPYYGCWGDPAEPYYGGGHYRQVLDAVYPAVKSINPDALVLAGALTLPCPGTCPMGTYIEGWGDSPNYDAISFHFYAWYSDTNLLNQSIEYLSKWGRPLWLTESAVTSYVCDAAQEQRSVDWARTLRSEWRLAAVTWFQLTPAGWKCTDLLRSDWTRKPVYKEWMP